MVDQALIEQLRDRKPWVLSVDDDPHITEGLKDILEDSGYGVVTANTGEEALAAIAARSFAVLIVDYSLPDINGLALTRKILAANEGLRAILMTGHGQVEFSDPQTIALFSTQLRKPVEVHTVLEAIEKAIRAQCQDYHLPEFVVQPVIHEAPQPLSLPVSAPVSLPSKEPLRVSALPQTMALATVALLVGVLGGWAGRGAHDRPVAPAPVACMPERTPELAISASTITLVTAFVEADSATVKPAVQAPLVAIAPKPAAPSRVMLEAQLSAADPRVRLACAKTLLKVTPDHAGARNALIALLSDDEAPNRLAAIEALSITHSETAPVILALSERLSDTEPSVAYSAYTVLHRIGRAALPVLATAMKDPDHYAAATTALARLDPEASATLPADNRIPEASSRTIAQTPEAAPAAPPANAAVSTDTLNTSAPKTE